jgi:hypothetical protein
MATMLCCVLTVGCAHAVPVVEAREQFAKVHQEAKQRASSALKEAKQTERLVRRMTDLVDNRQVEPLPELRRLAAAMTAAAQSLRARSRAIQKVRTRLSKLGRGRVELRANEPGWKLYQTLRQDVKRLEADSRQAYERFEEQPKAFKRLCKQHEIGPVDTTGYGDRMGSKIKEMDGWLRQGSAHLERVEYILSEEGADPESLRLVQAASVQLQAMTDTRAEVRRTALRFRLETKAGADAVIAPGMVTYNLFDRLDSLAADLKASSKRIQTLTKKIPTKGM